MEFWVKFIKLQSDLSYGMVCLKYKRKLCQTFEKTILTLFKPFELSK